MKIHVLALVLGVILTATSGAQTFMIDWVQPATVVGPADSSQIRREGTIRNLNGKAKGLLFSYDLQRLLLDHQAQLCITLCWALHREPDDPTERFEQELTSEGTLPIYVAISPYSMAGTSQISVTLFDAKDTTDKLSFTNTYVVDPTATVGDAKDVGIWVGPLPATESVIVRGDAVQTLLSMGLYDNNGNLIRSYSTSGASVATLPVSGLASGTYRLIMTMGNGTTVAAPVVIVH